VLKYGETTGKKMSLTGKEMFRELMESISPLSEAVVDRQYRLHPEIWEKYGQRGRAHSIEDMGYHISFLAESINVSDLGIFLHYVQWVKRLFEGLKLPQNSFLTTLQFTKDSIEEMLSADTAEEAGGYIDAALKSLKETDKETGISATDPEMSEYASEFLVALLDRDRQKARTIIFDAIDSGMPVRDVYIEIFQRSQHEIGKLWQVNRISVAQEHYCTAATQVIMAQLYPRIFPSVQSGHRLVAACVNGELHEIGIRMVADFFAMEGWDTCYLGANMPTNGIIEMLRDFNADVLALSATMTFHLSRIEMLISAVRESDCGDVKIMVGGYPFNHSDTLWEKIGADGYAADAKEAIIKVRKILS
jgi:methanogenic corrinoid protein MtbC1